LSRQPVSVSPVATSLDELVGLRDGVVALQRRLRRSAATRAGSAASRRLGRGLDFAEVREYQPGDDVRMIDWNVTARTRRPHTKLFVEELERPVHLVIDARSSMRFATRGAYKSVIATRLASLVGWAAVAAHDRVGGLVFCDDWHAEIRPDSGRRGLMGLFRAIVQAQRRAPDGATAPLSRTLERLGSVAHPGCSIYLFSDFAGFDERAASLLGGRLASRQLTAVQVLDPLDRDLPAGRPLKVATRGSRGGADGVDGADEGAWTSVRIGATLQRVRHRARFVEERDRLDVALARGRHRRIEIDTAAELLDSARRVLSGGEGARPATGSSAAPVAPVPAAS